VLLELYARALTSHGGALGAGEAARVDAEGLALVVVRSPGCNTVLQSGTGRLELVDLTLDVHVVADRRGATA
jgi:hypothetical protein